MRTTPVEYGEKPYNWNVDSAVYQCTWYSYYRALEVGLSAPCYWDRPTRTGSYTNAKEWLKNFREPWVVKEVGYIPQANDIVVFDGNYGHVAFIEEVHNNVAILSQYMSGKKDSFSNHQWTIGTNYTGQLLGYLHYEGIEPVDRNTNVNQVYVSDGSLRVRNQPSLSGEILGYAKVGYYNVLTTKENDGYTWYRIGDDKYIANVKTKYYPTKQTDIVRVIEDFIEGISNEVTHLKDDNDEYLSVLKQINKLSEVKDG